MSLHLCPSCERHVRDSICPFCGASAPVHSSALGTVPLGTRAAFLIGSVALVAGCNTPPAPAYGGPPPNMTVTPQVEPTATATTTASLGATAPSASSPLTTSDAGQKPIGPVKPVEPQIPVGPAPAYGGPPMKH